MQDNYPFGIISPNNLSTKKMSHGVRVRNYGGIA